MDAIKAYVLLKFDSARLYRENRDRTMTFKEPITKFQVANMLNALTGQKLVNTNRPTEFTHTDGMMEWAESCLIKYAEQTKFEYPMKSGVFRPHMLFIQTDKSMTNANHKSTRVEWYDMLNEVIVHGGDYKKYEEFLEFMFANYGVTPNMTFFKAIHIVFSTPNWKYFEEYITENFPKTRKGIMAAISGMAADSGHEDVDKKPYLGHETEYRFAKSNASSEVKRSRNLYTSHIVHKGVDMHERYDGHILVPIRIKEDEKGCLLEELEDYNQFMNGSGVATILDGGSVVVDSLAKAQSAKFTLAGFVKVGDLSLEKVKYYNLK